MAYGVIVSNANRTYLDILQPVWYLDFKVMAYGAGTLSYTFDASRFKINVLVLSWHYGSDPVFIINGNLLNFSGLDGCTFLVRMENL
ncbi:hypothetical protein B2M27_09945 [Kluyvera intermedia]|uniref:Uncharacterized protein n=1 Tax=Kluyvera intermedia TaxID=61648 RepID=A0ABX3UGT1_KLUIN|nr:hypothetical protein [Kluyvera intermedia]ORJ50586.1 hypothetical protein B2M27_09945 [Kluyvera intermedia]